MAFFHADMRFAAALLAGCCLTIHPASATVFGSLSNFDVVNDTGKEAHGFEIELEGIRSSEVTDTFGGGGRGFPPTVERYGSPIITDFTNGGVIGTRVTYRGTFSGSWNVGTPSGTFNTPGDSCWSGGGIGYGPSTPCDHFGVGTSATPAKTTYSWLVEQTPGSSTLVAASSLLPAPSWTVTPAPVVPGQPMAPPVVVARIQAPPADNQDPNNPQFGVPFWVKIFTTEFDGAIALGDLVAENAKVQDALGHTEVEWQLLQTEAGVPGSGQLENGGGRAIGLGRESVLRRYEFYKYTGAFNPQDNEALPGGGNTNPLPDEIGDLIGVQNAAVNLVAAANAAVPEPAGSGLLMSGLSVLMLMAIRRRNRAGS